MRRITWPTEFEAFNFISGIQNILFWTFFFWVVYLAFEPFVRRRWPGRIISWSRVLAGGFRDPLVGRDILIGASAGLGIIACYFYLPRLVQQWLGQPPGIPWMDFPATQLLGIRSFVFGFTNQIFAALFQSFILLFFLLLLYIILRRDRLAAIAVWLIGATALSPDSGVSRRNSVRRDFSGDGCFCSVSLRIVSGDRGALLPAPADLFSDYV